MVEIDCSFDLNHFAVYQGKLYFPGDNSTFWETDGTAAGTLQVPLSTGGHDTYNVSWLIPTPGGLYMLFQTSEGWRLNRLPPGGDSSETVYIFYNVNGVYASMDEMVGVGSQVALIVNMYGEEVDGPSDQLWFSDGTEAGTRRINSGFSQPSDLILSGGSLYFSASDPVHDVQIWRTDGTDSGTQRISGYAQKRCGTFPPERPIAAFTPGKFLLGLSDELTNPPGAGCELWLYDAFPQKVYLPAVRK